MVDPAGVNCPDVFTEFDHKCAGDRIIQLEKENKQIGKELKELSKKVTRLEKKIQKLKKEI